VNQINSGNTILKVAIITIGCRANQADSARMISSLHQDTVLVDPWNGLPDIAIVNTCAVTSRAEADARKLIRRIKRKSPDVKILVTGCAAQVDNDIWSDMPEVDLVIGLNARDEIEKYIHENAFTLDLAIKTPKGGIDGPTPLFGHRSRPFLKIQDGCSRGCAYCIVPKARGPERSRRPESIRDDIRNLTDAGFREIVLTGVHLGRWGFDFGSDINQLLDILDEVDLDVRFRFSSLEPMDLTPDIIRRIIGHPKICPHLHLPLQSGDRKILDLMGRNHSPADYLELLEAAIEANPDTALGTDIMVGFPGEDDESFINTLNFLKNTPLTYLHIFTFSPRKGTKAAQMSGKPSGETVSERMKALKSLDKSKRLDFRRSQDGKVRPFLIENPEAGSGILTALSDNYIRIQFVAEKYRFSLGQVITMRIDTNNDYICAVPEF
jgi:threonylcarbamoyladenosine tRNA methylthiotransferase MtaB